MFHLLPFAAGLLAGAAAVKLIREDKTKAGLDKAQDRLRAATVSGLSVIEQSSARLRSRLASETATTASDAVAAAPALAPVAAKPARKRAASRKAAAKPAKAAAKEGGGE